MHFFYLFILTLLNSIWQTAVLMLLYTIVNHFHKNLHPLQKRNLLYLVLFIQIILSVCSFYSLKYALPWSNIIVLKVNWFNNFIAAQQNILCYAYFSFIALKLAAIGFQWSSFYFTYKKYAVKPNASLRLYTSTHAAILGIRKKITVLYSTSIHSPITFGFFKPVILLPFALCTQLNIKDVEAIILHELAHIKNKDYLLNWFLVFVELIYVCNPFILFIIRKIKLEREKNCDTTVIHFKYDSISYAEALVHIAKNASGLKNFQIAAAKAGEQLLQRIAFFCNPQNFVFSKMHGFNNAIFILPLLLVLLIPSVQKQILISTNNNILLANNVQQPEKFYTPIITPTIVEQPNIIIENEDAENVIVEQPASTTEKIYFEAPTNTDFKFVSLVDTLQNCKEFIYKIETQEGRITNTYDLKFVNGKWILIPTYLIIQKYRDSNYMLQIDTTYNVLDSMIQ
jgi:beta-lactamase regulating signal transducer with metallopeptidase domain